MDRDRSQKTRTLYASPRRRREAAWALLFLGPSLVGFVVFTLLPVVASLALSATQWDLIGRPVFVAFENYGRALRDPLFGKVMLNTLYFSAGAVPGTIVISLALALALNQQIRGRVLFRTLYFMPVVSSTVAVTMIWRWMYAPFGVINALLTALGLPPVGWLTTPAWAMPAVIGMSVWQSMGHSIVIYLAGLQGIPRHLYDAAAVDGATGWRRFWHITLPLLSPTTFFVLVMAVIRSFQAFGQVYMLTGGGPAYATSTIVFYIYENAFLSLHMGYASALAWVLFGVIFLLTLVQVRYQNKWVTYD
jgi:multiple sugar transport system permease protein